MFKTGAQMLLLVVVAGLFLVRESHLWPCAVLDEGFGDWLSLNAPHPSAQSPAPVTFVAINDSSVANHAWPWTPLDYALFARAMIQFHPDASAIDEILDWKQAAISPGDRQKLPQYEKMLGDSLLQCPRLLLAAQLGWPEDPQVIPPLQEVPLVRNVKGDLRQIPEWTAIERQPKEEFRLAAAAGFTNVPTSRGPINAVPLLLRYRGEVVPSFVLQALVLWEKISLDEVTADLGSHVVLGSKLRIPIDQTGAMRVNFGTPYNVIGFDDLLLSGEQIAAKQKPAAAVDRLKGSIALLARTDRPSRKLSLAMGRPGSEGELFASAIATIQKQAFMRRVPIWVDFALMAIVGLVSLWIPRWRKPAVLMGASIALIVYGLGALAFFASQRMWMPLILPVGLMLFVSLYRLATPNQVPEPALLVTEEI